MTRGEVLCGQRFGRLVVLHRAGSTANGSALWACLCDCGARTTVKTGHLRSGNTASCGCGAKRGRPIHGDARRGAKTPEYTTWEGMIRRCHHPNATNYGAYGARGVEVCARWRESFPAFLADVGRRPSSAFSLDRINPFGNYEPGNVRWATRSEQARNKRRDWGKAGGAA